MKEVSIVWFRQDLRISDNPTLVAASEIGQILPIYIFDDCAPQPFKIGSVSKVGLHHSLHQLKASLNGCLNLYQGQSHQIIQQLIARYPVKKVFWNMAYEPWHLEQEKAVKVICHQYGIAFEAFNSNYLYHPEQVLKEEGSYYKVFTAYKNKALSLRSRPVIQPLPKAEFVQDFAGAITLEQLNLLPQNAWYDNIEKAWDMGEASAQKKLDDFVKSKLDGYQEYRNHPAKEAISHLSPHLHFGEISPAQVLESIKSYGPLYAKENDIEHFLSEMLWREFSCYLLYHFKELPIKNFKSQFDRFPWEEQAGFFEAWKKGRTGYPFIDAGMRQLWQTGFMHNRVRMVVASFLVKNLNIHWREGMNWFWDCLIDADLANNSASWQWVAGSGVDAAPYFRIFNPITQGEKFDPQGDYTKKFVPELKNLPDQYLFQPWTAPASVLKSAGVILGVTYPMPIIDFSLSRKNALLRLG